MSDQTPLLGLPYILPDQAQKHVTHNEALQRLDALVQLVCQGQLQAPPGTQVEGACYLVASAPSGGWEGKAGQIAQFIDGAWAFLQPKAGWSAYLATNGSTLRFDGAGWAPVTVPLPADSQWQTLGINTAADRSNRLAIAAAATLFTHEGGSHQMKINRGADANTGSILFQTGYSGRFEMGQAGDLNFSLKASQNGAAWKTALAVDPAGVIRMPAQPLCRAALNPVALSPGSGSFTGFQTLPVNQGGFALGAAVSPGTGQKLVVPANGLYLLVLNAIALSSQGHSITVLLNASTVLATLRGTAGSINTSLSISTIANLSQGDVIQLQHSGTAQLDFGPGKTELMMALL